MKKQKADRSPKKRTVTKLTKIVLEKRHHKSAKVLSENRAKSVKPIGLDKKNNTSHNYN